MIPIADRLFQDVDWGTDRVLQQTRERFCELKWTCRELPALQDLDRPEDLRKFPHLYKTLTASA